VHQPPTSSSGWALGKPWPVPGVRLVHVLQHGQSHMAYHMAGGGCAAPLWRCLARSSCHPHECWCVIRLQPSLILGCRVRVDSAWCADTACCCCTLLPSSPPTYPYPLCSSHPTLPHSPHKPTVTDPGVVAGGADSHSVPASHADIHRVSHVQVSRRQRGAGGLGKAGEGGRRRGGAG
jgi:hypothetical protein